MSLSQALTNLDSQEQFAAKMEAEVDAFIDGVNDYAKQANLSPGQYRRLWCGIGNVVESIPQFAKESQGVAPAAPAASVPGTPAAPAAAAPAAPAAPQQNWFRQFLSNLQAPGTTRQRVNMAIPGALAGLLVSLLGGGKHYLRNALLGGGLGYLMQPALQTISQRLPQQTA